MAAIFAACILAIILVLVPGMTTYLPLSAMAGGILLIAWNLIDFRHIKQILKANRREASVLMITLLSTLFIELEFAIYIGVFMSLAFYLRRTSKPTVMDVTPIQNHTKRSIRNINRYNLEQCPQLKIIRIDRSLFFGAIDHIQKKIRQLTDDSNEPNFILVIGKGINFVDVAGAEMLIQETNRLEQRGGDLMLSSFKGTVIDELDKTGYLDKLGRERFYESPQHALCTGIAKLNTARCQSCTARIFSECPTRKNE